MSQQDSKSASMDKSSKMRASELLNLYQRGKRNFRGVSLIGQNFDNQQLSNIDLSHADIRGASFVNTTLTGANFIYAKAGSTLIVSFIRTTFQLALASLAMSLASMYCNSMFTYLGMLRDPANDSAYIALGLWCGIMLYLSLFFLVVSLDWIVKNFIMLFCCYLITAFWAESFIYYY
jgi:Pentapeptide repeats (8 copies)